MRNLACIVVLLMIAGCASSTQVATPPAIQSGLQVGDDIIPWNPIHVAGPNAGTNACPVCTYEARPAIVIFAKRSPDLAALAVRLQDLVNHRRDIDLKGFLIVLDSTPTKLTEFAMQNNLLQIGVCYPDPAEREKDLAEYRINPNAANTVIVYRNYKVIGNFVNLSATDFDKAANILK
jgi:hypothetical protein